MGGHGWIWGNTDLSHPYSFVLIRGLVSNFGIGTLELKYNYFLKGNAEGASA